MVVLKAPENEQYKKRNKENTSDTNKCHNKGGT